MASVSVIMPVYNAAAHLEAAVQSVLRQTLQDLELILVDDGSTDGSAALCDAAAAADRRVRTVHQANAGICAARNRGLELAVGEYVSFCDDDDVFLPDFLATALAAAKENDADLVRLDYRLFRSDAAGHESELRHPAGKACRLIRGENPQDYGAFLRAEGPLFVWNAIYRRAALGNLCFDPRCRRGVEDFVFNTAFHARMERAVYLPQVACLHYERARGSTSACFSQAAVEARVQAAVLWAQAEAEALARWCTPENGDPVRSERRAELITFLMHQLRDAHAPHKVRRESWRTLRQALDEALPSKGIDFLRVEGQNKKQILALFLYAVHLQGLYQWFPNREDRE